MEMTNGIHNYAATLTDVHSALKKIAMIDQMKNEIFKILKIQISFVRIVFSLRVVDSVIDVSFADSSNFEIVNSMFKLRNIYNMKAQLRREAFGPLTPVQALIKEFDEKN